ncbi:MAG: hypothetical protein AB1742_04665 [bacterium]
MPNRQHRLAALLTAYCFLSAGAGARVTIPNPPPPMIDFQTSSVPLPAPAAGRKPQPPPLTPISPLAPETPHEPGMYARIGFISDFDAVNADAASGNYMVNVTAWTGTFGAGIGNAATLSLSSAALNADARTPAAAHTDSFRLNVLSAAAILRAHGSLDFPLHWSFFDAGDTNYHYGAASLRRTYRNARAQGGVEITGGGDVPSTLGALLHAEYQPSRDLILAAEYHGSDPFKNVPNIVIPRRLTAAGFSPCTDCETDSLSLAVRFVTAGGFIISLGVYDAADLDVPMGLVHYAFEN